MRTGTADLPLHYGKAPPWLFGRMVKLSAAIVAVIERDFGKDEFLRRMADPFWFQSFGCVLGFDWHSSGVTTTVCGALKEALGPEYGIVVAGGKGKTSRKAPEEIEKAADAFSLSSTIAEKLVYSSRIAAKVDNTALQDGYQLYHHAFIMTEDGKWAVVQQGMNDANSYARRYHWLSEKVESFVVEPHAAICCDQRGKALNMVALESGGSRSAAVDVARESTESLKKTMSDAEQKTLTEYGFVMQREHPINIRLYRKLSELRDFQPSNFEELLAFKGVGPKTIRALALLGELIYGAPPSWRDPAKYSFAFGGKDNIPRPLDKPCMDETTELLYTAVQEAKLESTEKLNALRRLRCASG